MGCGSSSQRGDADPPSRPMNIGPPTDLMLHVPTPRTDEHGNARRISDHELDRRTLEGALDTMAQYIHARGENITVISTGGAVNTLLLQTRQSTHDVDFFGTNLTNQQRRLVDEAAYHAYATSSIPLGSEWFNNQTQLWLTLDNHRRLTQLALDMDEVVYQRPGLKIIAAPWSYAFSSKVARIMTGTFRPYDHTDAADYLHHHNQRRGRPATESEVRRWGEEVRHEMNSAVIKAIMKEYRRRYGTDGIVRG